MQRLSIDSQILSPIKWALDQSLQQAALEAGGGAKAKVSLSITLYSAEAGIDLADPDSSVDIDTVDYTVGVTTTKDVDKTKNKFIDVTIANSPVGLVIGQRQVSFTDYDLDHLPEEEDYE